MGFRLVALDIDGTILDSRGAVGPRIKAAVRRAREAGVTVVLATGRRFRAAQPVAEELGIRGPLVLNNGALVIGDDGQEVLYHRPLQPGAAARTVRLLEEQGLAPVLYRHTTAGPDVFYRRPTEDPWFKRLQNRPDVLRQVNDLGDSCHPGPDKILVWEEQDRLHQLEAQLRGALGQSVRVYVSLDDHNHAMLEVVHGSCSKAGGVRRVAARMGVSRRQVVAVGDHLNDLDLIRYAGLGVAMGNAREEVKASARLVTGTNDEEGAADVLERYVLPVA